MSDLLENKGEGKKEKRIIRDSHILPFPLPGLRTASDHRFPTLLNGRASNTDGVFSKTCFSCTHIRSHEPSQTQKKKADWGTVREQPLLFPSASLPYPTPHSSQHILPITATYRYMQMKRKLTKTGHISREVRRTGSVSFLSGSNWELLRFGISAGNIWPQVCPM